MKEEIVAGIKNALERGESVDEAMQSFINSGYKSVEVREAANSLTGGTMPLLNPSPAVVLSSSSAPQHAAASPAPSAGTGQGQPPQQQPTFPASPVVIPSAQKGPLAPGTDKKKIILLVALLLVLVGILIATILYKDKILAAFS